MIYLFHLNFATWYSCTVQIKHYQLLLQLVKVLTSIYFMQVECMFKKCYNILMQPREVQNATDSTQLCHLESVN